MEINWEKKYNEALERARALREEAIEKEYVNDYVKDYEAIFPELAESEDERIRKQLVDIVAFIPEANFKSASREDCRAYLEKQKEQTPGWSEENEKILVAISKALGCDTAEKILVNEGVTLVMAAGFLESLKNRGNSQESNTNSPSWKPSVEQMWQLGYVAEQNKHNMLGKELMTLYNDLKKLM